MFSSYARTEEDIIVSGLLWESFVLFVFFGFISFYYARAWFFGFIMAILGSHLVLDWFFNGLG